MSLKNLDEIEQLIRKHFEFLFNKDAKFINSEYDTRFGNFVIVLETAKFRIRFFRDCGTITIQFGTPWASVGWSGEPWYDLIILIWFLTEKQLLISGYWEDRFEDEMQLERLAKALRSYYEEIIELFNSEIFDEKKESLDLANKEVVSLLFEPHRHVELQKLLNQSAKFWQQ